MYGATGKLGRGGVSGGRRGKQVLPSLHRSGGTERLPASGGGGPASRHRHGGSTSMKSSAPNTAQEETFNLVNSGSLAFGMIVRLTPDIVEEIRRVESDGGIARIKFDSNSLNPVGNVIDVGGKDFRFTCSWELGDLCDIYEECRSGENGNGLLVESGSAWRKLTLQRILDESTKNLVKMRSEEAERISKSRKSIVLDHGNPSVKDHAKTIAAVDTNHRRMFKSKKEPPSKRRKVESIQGPPKASFKPSISSKTSVKGRSSLSPLPPSPSQVIVSASPSGPSNFSKSHTSTMGEGIGYSLMKKEETSKTEKEIPNKIIRSTGHEVLKSRGINGAFPVANEILKPVCDDNTMDLESTLIFLLKENAKGMTLKALEKAVGDKFPNSLKKIEAVVKKIASFHAPGRYLLKPGVEIGKPKDYSCESGSSPECEPPRLPNMETSSSKKVDACTEIQTHNTANGEELDDLLQKNHTQEDLPEHLDGDSKVINCSERRDSSSDSDSDSDSDSESSDSDSDSESQSRSRSHAGSGSSSDDSDSDGSSSNKEGSDVDVDIMSEDEKEECKNKLQDLDSRLLVPWKNDEPEQGNLDDNEIDVESLSPIQITKDIQKSDERDKLLPFNDQLKMDENIEMEITNNETSCFEANNHGTPSSLRGRRSLDPKYLPERPESSRKSKGYSPYPVIHQDEKYCSVSGSPNILSPKVLSEDQLKNHTDKIDRDDGFITPETQKVATVPGKSLTNENIRRNNLGFHNSSNSDIQMSDQRSNDTAASRNFKKISVFSDEMVWSSSKNMQLQENTMPKQKLPKELQNESCNAHEKYSGKNSRGMSSMDQSSFPSDSYDRKSVDQVGKLKNSSQIQTTQAGNLFKDNRKSEIRNLPSINGKGSVLRRELSELELGEFREPSSNEEAQDFKQKLDKNSSKVSENKTNYLDKLSTDSVVKEKILGKVNQESRKMLSPNSRVGAHGSQENSQRKGVSEDIMEDSIGPQQRTLFSKNQHFSKLDRVDKTADNPSKVKKNDAKSGHGCSLENHTAVHNTTISSFDSRNKYLTNSDVPKENKQKFKIAKESVDSRREADWVDRNNHDLKKRQSSCEEEETFYLNYDKEEPELKGPIKNYLQYKEYTKEYQGKYDCYILLYERLQNFRNEFLEYNDKLETAKDKNMEDYYTISKMVMERYHQCGMKHKKMKKIFITLHEELKTLKQRIKDFVETYTKDSPL